jgi:membrane protease YdiL (CAAX protease family)
VTNPPSFHHDPTPSSGGGRIGLLIAWVVIATIVSFGILSVAMGPSQGDDDDRPDAQASSFQSAVVDFQLKYIVGAAQLAGSNDQMTLMLDTLNTGPVVLRQRCVAIIGAIGGPAEGAEAVGHLTELMLDHDVVLDGPALQTQHVLEDVFPDAPAVSPAVHASRVDALDGIDREAVVTQLGWAGELLLHPVGGDDPGGRKELVRGATILVAWVVGGMMVVGGAGLLGLIGLILVVIFLATGRLCHHFGLMGQRHSMYAQVFAWWLVIFVGSQYLLMALIPESWGSLLWSLLPFLGSLVVVGWPMVWGVTWRQIRTDIGWTFGEGLLREVACGVGGYIMALPMLAVGLALTVVLMAISGGGDVGANPFELPPGPSHPVVEIMINATPWTIAMVFILASIVAPLVEETIFRGVLYGHLRQAWGGGGAAISVIGATLFSSLIFAAIHPQGWVTIPALGSLACAFALVREWRGSLVAPMVMHGVSNGIVLGVGLAIFS